MANLILVGKSLKIRGAMTLARLTLGSLFKCSGYSHKNDNHVKLLLSSAVQIHFTFHVRSRYCRKVCKVLPKSSQGIAEKLARYCRKVRKGLLKLRWGSKKHSKESGSGVFERHSELEREELYLNEKKIHIDVHPIKS